MIWRGSARARNVNARVAMHTVRVVVVVSSLVGALGSVAVAEPAPVPQMTFGISAFMNRYPTGGFHVAGAYHLTGAFYGDAQVSLGAHVRTGDSEIRVVDESLWSAQIGASAISWSEHSAWGARTSVGYTTHEAELYDFPEDVTTMENHDAAYLEVAGFARARLTPHVALEALVAGRFGVTTSDPRLEVTGVLSAGFHVMW